MRRYTALALLPLVILLFFAGELLAAQDMNIRYLNVSLVTSKLRVRNYLEVDYSGTYADALNVDYTGSGNNIFDFQADSVSVMSLSKAGVLTFTGTLTTGTITISDTDPALILDPTTAGDTEFYFAINEDAGGDDNDTVSVGKGTTPGTTEFFTWDKDGGFIAQNLTDSVTGYQFLDSDGGTPVFNVDTTNERVGIGTAAPDHPLHVIGNTFASGLLYSGSTASYFNGSGQQIVFGNAVVVSRAGGTGAVTINTNASDLILSPASNVGIEVVTPAEKLSVFDGNIEAYDSNDLASESLDEVDFATHAKWDTVGDFDDTGGNAAYTHSGGTGTLTQTSGNMVISGVGNRWYKFTYTVSAVTETGTLAATITTAFAASAVTLTVDTNATDTVYFQSTASPGNFIISATSDTGGDTFTIDDVTLKEITGGDAIVNGLVTGGGTKGIRVLANGDVIIGAGTNHDGYVLRPGAEVQTTDATVTTVDSFTLADNNTYLVKASVAGFEDGASYAGYEIIATVRRDGGGATILGGVTSVHTTETVGAWDATFTVNSNDVRVSVTGEAATVIEWSCTMQFMNVGI